MNSLRLAPGPILSLDASGTRSSAALLLGGEAPIEREAPLGERAGTALHLLLLGLLEEAGLRPFDLSLVVAIHGPGSFTGLRVALAAAQGLCLAAGLPGVSVETTGALAWATSRQGRVGALIDGGQGRLFCGRSLREGESQTALGAPEDLGPGQALARLGDGSCEAWFLRGEPSGLEALLLAGAERFDAPLSAAAAEMAARGLASPGLEPLYARAPAIRSRPS